MSRARILSDEEVGRRARARMAAHRALLRGDIIPEPCEGCGRENAEMHHPDHERPLVVIWLCRRCHSDEHVVERRVSAVRLNDFLRNSIKRLKAVKRKTQRTAPHPDMFQKAGP